MLARQITLANVANVSRLVLQCDSSSVSLTEKLKTTPATTV